MTQHKVKEVMIVPIIEGARVVKNAATQKMLFAHICIEEYMDRCYISRDTKNIELF